MCRKRGDSAVRSSAPPSCLSKQEIHKAREFVHQHRGPLRRKPVNKHQRMAIIVLSGACIILSLRVFGQMHDQNAPQPQLTLEGMSPQEVQLMRHDLRKQKQKLISDNIPTTESE